MALSLGLGIGYYKLGGEAPLLSPGLPDIQSNKLELWLKNHAKGGSFFGQHIGQWNDFSGNVRHAQHVDGTGSYIAIGTDDLIARNDTTGGITFERDGISSFSLAGTDITLDAGFTMFVVAAMDIPSTANNMYFLSNGIKEGDTGSNSIRIFDAEASQGGQLAMARDNAGQRFITESESGGEASNALQDGVKSVISIAREGNSIGDKIVYKVNGVNIPDDDAGGTYGAANDGGTLTITKFGLDQTTGQNPHGEFFEVVLYSTFLNNQDYTDVYNDVAARCDLPTI